MQNSRIKCQRKNRILPYLLLLTGAMLAWQCFVIGVSSGGFFMLSAVMSRLSEVPHYVWGYLLFYWVLQIITYVILTLIIWVVGRLFSQLMNFSWRATWWFTIGLWFAAFLALALANEVIYAKTFFAGIVHIFLPYWLGQALLILLGIVLLFVFFGACYQLIRIVYKKPKVGFLLLIPIIFISGLIAWHYTHLYRLCHLQKHSRPNIIIIGIDSLRPDRLTYNGYLRTRTLTIDKFLKQATNFTQAITPLARTSPAWVSILTGQYPLHNGVQFNLVRLDKLSFKNTLPAILRRHGYETVFSTDGRRFDFIDEEFGFNKVIGAQLGVKNFLMDIVDNMPLSDFLVNTRLGRYIYPNIYGNRDVEITYRPKEYLKLLESQLPLDSKKPLFLAVHFTLPHFPYYWAAIRSNNNTPHTILYDLAVRRVDLQIAHFMAFLKKKGLLNNAIVVFLSDHGESFAIPGDRMISHKKYVKGKKQQPHLFKLLNALEPDNKQLSLAAGHGTDVLSFTQYHVLMAFRCYGNYKNVAGKVNHLTSLIDIKPTILNLLGLSSPNTDGISLLPYLQGRHDIYKKRMIFTETGFTPIALKKKKISIRNAVVEGVDIFTIDKATGKIVVKKSMIPKLLLAKQRALYYGDWVLALYSDNHKHFFPVLVNRQNGAWTDDFSTSFAKNSPARQMFSALKSFYGKQVIFN